MYINQPDTYFFQGGTKTGNKTVKTIISVKLMTPFQLLKVINTINFLHSLNSNGLRWISVQPSSLDGLVGQPAGHVRRHLPLHPDPRSVWLSIYHFNGYQYYFSSRYISYRCLFHFLCYWCLYFLLLVINLFDVHTHRCQGLKIFGEGPGGFEMFSRGGF